MERKIVLTGDRPTGPLHIGHYVGSLKKRVEMQESGDFQQFVMIADIQALTDNADNPAKIRENILEVMLDYLAVGLDPERTTIFVQSKIPALFELPMYYSNLVTLSRLQRNPTIKSEIKMRGFEKSIPVGFLTYPISQAADITAFRANLVPVGVDQLPMLEQTREIVNSFNNLYKKDVLVLPEAVLPDNENAYRIVGIDGGAKMSKSLGNCIFLKDDAKTVEKKIMSMFTDPNHIKVSEPGKIEGNVVFTYLDIFCKNEHFEKYCPDYKNLQEMKDHYRHGGLGDVKVKKFLNSILQEILTPIRERRIKFANNKKMLLDILAEHSRVASDYANITLDAVRDAIGIKIF